MPRISTPIEAPTLSTLKLFADKLNTNAMYVPSWTSPFGHFYLTIKDTDFIAENSGTPAVVPTDPGNVVTAPTPVTRPATRTAVAAAISACNPTQDPTIADTDPFDAQETIRVHQLKQAAYTTFTTTRTLLQSMIIN